MIIGVVVLVSAALAIAALMVLTGLGEHRRGAGAPLVLLAGIMFPVTWTAWYAKDDLSAHRQAHRAV